MQIIMLGTGSSTGTPVIGCDCSTCTSTDPRNQRTRCSAAVLTDAGQVILIDTSPDLRLQALREGLVRVDAVLYTHNHADHMNGIDDLRNFCYLQKQAIPVFGNEATINSVRQRFAYAFAPITGYWNKPVLSAHIVAEEFEIEGVKITPITIWHGPQEILGYRINNIAYITDVSEINENSLSLLKDLDVLLLDCLHERPHTTHFHFDKSLEYAEKIGARSTYLIHMTHQMEHSELVSRLPANIYVGYDGLHLNL